jgi:hypothetical protein
MSVIERLAGPAQAVPDDPRPQLGEVVHVDRHRLVADALLRHDAGEAVGHELDHAEHPLPQQRAADGVQRGVAGERLQRAVQPLLLEVVFGVAAELLLGLLHVLRLRRVHQRVDDDVAEVDRRRGRRRLLHREVDASPQFLDHAGRVVAVRVPHANHALADG